MPGHIRGFRMGLAAITAIGIFVPEHTGLSAEAVGQGGRGITLDMGRAKGPSPQEIHDRGIMLRAELDKAFNSLPGSGKAGHADEFTAIVLPYISAGMALEDAVDILTAAGFTAPGSGAREAQNSNRGTEQYAVVAEIPQFSGRVFGNVETYVMPLVPARGLAEYVGRRHRMMYDASP